MFNCGVGAVVSVGVAVGTWNVGQHVFVVVIVNVGVIVFVQFGVFVCVIVYVGVAVTVGV
jgi:hypothetical protein